MNAVSIRRIILTQSHRAHLGHVGSALSVADMLAALYSGVLRTDGPRDPDRDRFILGKGHAVLALYAALHLRGWLSAAQLDTYGMEGTWLGTHPDRRVPGIDFSTGSLGHGLSLGAGAALAARLQRSRRRAFVLISDAECNAGATWEAVMFGAHHRLANLFVLVDLNGQQAFGHTRNVLSLDPLIDRFRAFGWDACEVNGHDGAGIAAAIDRCDAHQGSPHAIICKTTFGKGVSFMEGRIPWHYLPMTDEQYQQALAEVDAGGPVG